MSFSLKLFKSGSAMMQRLMPPYSNRDSQATAVADGNQPNTTAYTPDLEKNIHGSFTPNTTSPPTIQNASATAPPPEPYIDPGPLPPSLIKFQNIIGISVSPTMQHRPGRPGQNLGIYKRVVDKEEKVKASYKVASMTINACFLLQIVFGAGLTALGAGSGPAGAVTTLGAINTILAGLLTYLKGQGLPGRLEQHFHLLRTLREHIEEVERNLSEGSGDIPVSEGGTDVDEEIKGIVRMYMEVRQTAEDNRPGNVVAPKGKIGELMEKVEGQVRGPADAAAGAVAGVQANGNRLEEMAEKWQAKGLKAVEDRKQRELAGVSQHNEGPHHGIFDDVKGFLNKEKEMEGAASGSSSGGAAGAAGGMLGAHFNLEERIKGVKEAAMGKKEEGHAEEGGEGKKQAAEGIVSEVEGVRRRAQEEIERLEQGVKKL